ncbi:MAG: GNAT family N-acetyltransferase [Actinobacteria bacterium]|nr:GNAT family N-acetyltransferase [Actinomycetota bacterium]
MSAEVRDVELPEVEVRDLVDEDLPAVVRLWNGTHPHLVMQTEERLRHIALSVPPQARRVQRVAVAGGQVVGYASARLNLETSEPGQGHVTVVVDAGHRRRGIGGALLAGAQAHLLAAGATTLHSRTGDEAGSAAFAQRHGFTVTRQERFQRADLTVLETLSGVTDAPGPPDGVRVVPVTGLTAEAVHACDAAATLDMPGDVTFDAMDLDRWRADVWDAPGFDRALSHGAVDASGRVLALALLETNPQRRAVWSGMTGTLREARGLGLARLVKIAALRAAAAAGYTQAWTGNDDSNAAMRAVNTRLGYTVAVTGCGVLRRVRPTGA